MNCNISSHPLRHAYSIKEKCYLVNLIDILVAYGFAGHRSCAMISMWHQYYSCFKSLIQTSDGLNNSDTYVHYKMNGSAPKLHHGYPSALEIICNNLDQFIQGIWVSAHMLQHEACHLLPPFSKKVQMQ